MPSNCRVPRGPGEAAGRAGGHAGPAAGALPAARKERGGGDQGGLGEGWCCTIEQRMPLLCVLAIADLPGLLLGATDTSEISRVDVMEVKLWLMLGNRLYLFVGCVPVRMRVTMSIGATGVGGQGGG